MEGAEEKVGLVHDEKVVVFYERRACLGGAFRHCFGTDVKSAADRPPVCGTEKFSLRYPRVTGRLAHLKSQPKFKLSRIPFENN